MLTNAQHKILNSDEIIKHHGSDPEFWVQAEVFCAKETAKFGLPLVKISYSASEPRGKYAHYEPWNNRMVIFYINSRPAKFIFNSVMHELAHHIHDGLRQAARVRQDWVEAARLNKGGRVHGLGFKEVLTTLEHENAPQVPHSPWGNAGCRGSSRLSRKDWNQRYSTQVCEKVANSTPKTKKVEMPSFEVKIKIHAPFASTIKGVVYGEQTITTITTAKNEQSAINKTLRSFGIKHRSDINYTIAIKEVATAPNVSPYTPASK